MHSLSEHSPRKPAIPIRQPIWNYYETRDGRHIALIMPMALPYWGAFCELMNRPDWASDPRFATLPGMAEHGPSIVPEIEQAFAENDLDAWRPRLDQSGLIWEPVALLPEVIEDPALREQAPFPCWYTNGVAQWRLSLHL